MAGIIEGLKEKKLCLYCGETAKSSYHEGCMRFLQGEVDEERRKQLVREEMNPKSVQESKEEKTGPFSLPKKKQSSGKNVFCEDVRPSRDVICQKMKGHKGKHRAVIYWEDEG